jgi:hypothetical protein
MQTLDSTNPKDSIGLKKTPLRLVPPALLVFVAHVMALGAKKYGEWNWRDNKVRHTVYLEAAIRHLQAALDGEDADSESGLPHEAHAAACMGIVLDAKQLNCLIDDRNKSGYVQGLMDSLIERSNEKALERFIQLERDRSFRETLEVISPSQKVFPHNAGECVQPVSGGLCGCRADGSECNRDLCEPSGSSYKKDESLGPVKCDCDDRRVPCQKNVLPANTECEKRCPVTRDLYPE